MIVEPILPWRVLVTAVRQYGVREVEPLLARLQPYDLGGAPAAVKNPERKYLPAYSQGAHCVAGIGDASRRFL